MKISVIIPTLNEAPWIAQALASVHQQTGPFEVMVVDGGSIDDTRAQAQPHATVLTAPRGRATQMNAGAQHATGEVLLFLHADTMLPPNAFALIRETVAQENVAAGCFRLRFDRNHPLLRLYSACTRTSWHRLCFGDCAPFFTRDLFAQIGGFPDVPFFEDVYLMQQARRRTRIHRLPAYVTTSARRFEQYGILRQQIRNVFLWTLAQTGMSPAILHPWYPAHKTEKTGNATSPSPVPLTAQSS